jgi:hypothetical protein
MRGSDNSTSDGKHRSFPFSPPAKKPPSLDVFLSIFRPGKTSSFAIQPGMKNISI